MLRTKLLMLACLAMISLTCSAQIVFEKGYFIDQSGNRVDCLIKNVDWRSNPSAFDYRTSMAADPVRMPVETVREFGINMGYKYLSRIIDIDRSSNMINDLSVHRAPKFQKDTIFLKTLVEGKANLYQYIDGNLERYFYSVDGSDIKQLVYKRFRGSNNNINVNNQFRQQLWNELKCGAISSGSIDDLDYKKQDMVSFFIKYNKCHGQSFVNYEVKQKRDLFNLWIRPRLNSSSLKIVNSALSTRNTDFGNKIGFGIGVEAEYILPFNKTSGLSLLNRRIKVSMRTQRER